MNGYFYEQKQSPIPVWIDLDTGVDDAIALMCACALEAGGKLAIKGVSAVSGNVPLTRTFENCRDVLSMCGRSDIPVYAGADRPLIEEPVNAVGAHGADGLGGNILEPSKAPRETEKAWDALYRCAQECHGELELILTGPETNAAIAFMKYPQLKTMIRRILVMGGADIGGNATAAAEFNIYADPHAAQAVLESGLPIVMCGLDVTMKAVLPGRQVRELVGLGAKAAPFFQASMELVNTIMKGTLGDECTVHDACPVLYAVYPELFTGVECGVSVETRGTLTRGQTVTDWDTDNKFPVRNVLLVRDVDRAAFAQRLMELLAPR